MLKLIRSFARDESGATAIEYALIAAFLSVAFIGGLSTLGTKVSTRYTAIASAIP